MHLLAKPFGPFHKPSHILLRVKSLPFHIPAAWNRYPFRAEPPHIGNYREYPPPRGPGPDRMNLQKSGAHKPERATPIISLCNSVFPDRFIFGILFYHFFPRKWKHRSLCVPYMVFKFGRKIDLKINWSVKKPLHGTIARSGLWASADIHYMQYKHSSFQKAFSEKKIQTVIYYRIWNDFAFSGKPLIFLTRWGIFYGWWRCWRPVTSPTMVAILDFTKN